MYAGTIVETGPCVEVFERQLNPYTWGLLRARPSLTGPVGRPERDPGPAGLGAGGAAPAARSRRDARGRPTAAPRSARRSKPVATAGAPPASESGRSPMSSAEPGRSSSPSTSASASTNVARWLRRRPAAGVEAVTDLSFEIPRGGSLALVGESGSGKTTTARMIVGLERPHPARPRVGRAGGRQGRRRRRAPGARAEDPDGLPGSVYVAGSAPDRAPDARRGAELPHRAPERRTGEAD